MPCPYQNQRQGILHQGMKLITLVLFTAILIANAPAHAGNSSADQTKKLLQLRQEIKNLQQELNKTSSTRDLERNKLKAIETRIGRHVHELRYIRHRMSRQDHRLAKLGREKQALHNTLSQQQQLLGKQLKVAYMMGQQAWIKLLLNQNNADEAGRTMTYYRYFNASRTKHINNTTQALARIAQLKVDIAQEQARLTTLQHEHRDKKQQLEQASSNKSILLAKLNIQLKDKQQTLQRLRNDEKQLQRLLNTIQQVMPDELTIKQNQQRFSTLKGKLNWPVSGAVKQLFGHQRGSTDVRWNGVLINAKEGRQVRAISHGRVAYADWLRGYGLLLIIDHGHGYMSLYGHNQSLFKETGDWVEADEIIAAVGNSGGQQQNGLYFEIRYQGKPTNPIRWYRKQRRA